jgi:transketolase
MLDSGANAALATRLSMVVVPTSLTPLRVTESPSAASVCGKRIRRHVLDQSMRAHVGHIGSALSIADMVGALYGGILNVEHPDHADRDRFVLSKGHAALALYAALHLRGWLTAAQLDTYCGDDSLLGVHPERSLCGVDFSTGSLGQGLSVAAGSALAARMQGSNRRVFALLSDAECNEGSVWEAAMFAAHHKLSNLVVMVDLNGQQAFGYTRDVLEPSPLAQRWEAFGWHVRHVDGHDSELLARTVASLHDQSERPHVLIAHTVFGRGVTYMENQIKWHYWPMSDAQYEQAIDELATSLCAVHSSAH